MTYPQLSFKLIHKNNGSKKGILQLSKIGNIKAIISRDINVGKIKTCTIKGDQGGDWFASFAIEFPDIISMDITEIQPQIYYGRRRRHKQIGRVNQRY